MKRPFRLELHGSIARSTFATEQAARDVAAKLATGTGWRIVERRREMGPRGREREVRVVVAEGVS